MPAVTKSLKRKREIIAKVKPKKKCPSTIGEGNTESGNARRPLSWGGRKKCANARIQEKPFEST